MLETLPAVLVEISSGILSIVSSKKTAICSKTSSGTSRCGSSFALSISKDSIEGARCLYCSATILLSGVPIPDKIKILLFSSFNAVVILALV